MFGYDFFIAYSQSDGSDYAKSLHSALSKDFTVHFDIEDYHAGNNLDLLTKVRVKNSSHLLVVATPAALSDSIWVKKETDQFLKMGKIPLIVDVDGSVEEALRAPNNDRLSGWVHSEMIKQSDGGIIDPILKIQDSSGLHSNGYRAADVDVVHAIKASFKGARIEQRRLRIVTITSVVLFAMLLVTAWMANTAYRQLVSSLESNSEVSAVAAISLTEQGHMPEALSRAKDALPKPDEWIQAYDPLAISAAIAVFNGLAIGSSEEMKFHIKDADTNSTGELLATVEVDFTEGGRNSPRWGRLWSMQTGALINQVQLPRNTSFAVEVISDQDASLYGGFAGELLLWDFDTDTVETFSTNLNLTAIEEIVSKDGLGLVGVASSRGVDIIDVESRQSVGHTFSRYDTGMSGKPDHSFDLHPNGTVLAAQTKTGVAVFNFIEDELLCNIHEGDIHIVSLRFSPSGKRLGLIADDGGFFIADFNVAEGCSEIRPLTLPATKGAFLCGQYPVQKERLSFVDKRPWVLKVTNEQYRQEDLHCASLVDWEQQKTVSSSLLGRDMATIGRKFLEIDDPHPAQRDLSYLGLLDNIIVTDGLDVFSYRRELPKGFFIRKRWLRLDIAQEAGNKEVPTSPALDTRPKTSNSSNRSWDCVGYASGRDAETVAVSKSGRFVVVADRYALRMHDRKTCARIGTWPIDGQQSVEFSNDESAILVGVGHQTLQLPLPTSLDSENLATRLQAALSKIR
nr:WD40 repeat domain-containing protein [Aliiroseovarius sp. F20344]